MLKPKVSCVGGLASGARAILTWVFMLLASPGTDGLGRAFDNVFCEHVWRNLRCENIYLNRYDTVRQLQTGSSDDFGFYSHVRPHQSLNYRTPAEERFVL